MLRRVLHRKAEVRRKTNPYQQGGGEGSSRRSLSPDGGGGEKVDQGESSNSSKDLGNRLHKKRASNAGGKKKI